MLRDQPTRQFRRRIMHPNSKGRDGRPASTTDSFAFTLITALGLALIAAAIIAPVAAMVLGVLGFRFPFPRIFDRTVMVTLFAGLLLQAPRLKLVDRLRRGFRNPNTGIWHALSGLVLAGAAIAVLFGMAAIAGADINGAIIARPLLHYFPAAILIAVLEEAFFRAFLLSGIEAQVGSFGALLASSAIYAIVHLMRSPARFYVTDFEPLAGAETLASYADRMIHPEIARPLLGLFLLGVVLGEAFLLTRRAYFSLGVHAGFVLGAKTWRVAVSGGIPQWLAGPGSVPLVGAPAAWILSVIMLALLHLWPGASEPCFGAASLSPPSSDYECDSAPISETQPERTDRSGSV